jgi:hypothetical protein
MVTEKRVLCPERVRHVPRGFSWIDHRLVRDGHIGLVRHEAQALYLFLVTVADAEGLSYYSDGKAAQLLNMDEAVLMAARRELCQAGLIAYRKPLYQVLSLEGAPAAVPALRRADSRRRLGEAVSIGEVLGHMLGGAV